MRHPVTRTAVIVAVTAGLGMGHISAADYLPKLSARPQIAQGTENPRDDTAAPAPAPAPGPAAVTTTVVDQRDVEPVLGRQVRSSAGEDMGRVVNVVVDRSGQVRAAVIDFGGFLGVGNRKIAIDWNALHFPPAGSKDDRITLDLTRDQVKAAPEYKDGRPLVMIGAAESLPSYPAPD
jgi:hypothetical protein